jgi:hypothetical protein
VRTSRSDTASASFNVLTVSAISNDWATASECYATLNSLAEQHPDESIVRQPEGAHGLSWHRLRSGDAKGAEDVFSELMRLGRARSDVEQIRFCAARAAYNLMHTPGFEPT